MRSLLASLLCVLLLPACGGERAAVRPSWQALAQAHRPADAWPLLPGPEGPLRWAPEERPDGRVGAWLTERLGDAAWRQVGPDLWHTYCAWFVDAAPEPRLEARLALDGEGEAGGQTRQATRLEVGGLMGPSLRRALAGVDDLDPVLATLREALRPTQPGGVAALEGRDLWLLRPAESGPPKGARLRVWIDRGRPDSGGWRVQAGPLAGRGCVLLAGVPELRQVTLQPGSALRFSGWASPRPGARLQVTWNRQPVGELDLEAGLGGEGLQVDLGDLQGQGELGLAYVAITGRAVLFEPVVGPAEVGSYAERPWVRRHPDVVLVCADTFRADNLVALGGDPAWSPHLNRLAEEAVLFEAARSPSSWTLPAHGAFFTGRMPRQIMAHTRRSRLSDELVTLAERFAQAGYRVEAITERGFVSRAYGLDQGFGRFEEQDKLLGRTAPGWRAALARDDGRPLFLFVHSYRAHGPYLVGEQAAQAVGLEEPVDAIRARVAGLPALEPGSQLPAERRADLAALRTAYRGASWEMDALFGELRQDLERAGLPASGYLALTSDHGESFGEHGVLGHGSGIWEEEVHVPLLIHGPGLGARRVEQDVSLVDLPRTLTALASLEPDPSWGGRDLLADLEPRPVTVFQCGSDRANFVAVVEDGRKLVLPIEAQAGELGPVRFAYDLEQDGQEQHNLVGEAPWIGSLDARLRPLLEEHAQPLTAGQEASVDAAHAAELEALGYTGD